VETIRQPLLVLDTDLKVNLANQDFYRTFHVTPGETLGSFIYELGNKQWDIPRLRILLEKILPEKEVFTNFEVSHDFRDIGRKTMLLNARQIYRKDIAKKLILVAIEDITERNAYEEKLKHFAIHDQLTGLLNRQSMEDTLGRTIAKAKRGAVSSLLYMDLDNFKEINDSVGHNAGDGVLITLAGLFKNAVRTEDIVFRLGGDEFAVLLEGMAGRESLPAAERLRATVEAHTFELEGRVFPLSLSLGLIEIDGALNTGELLSQADAAMYRAKAQGRNRVVVA
jgi:diguanylate cyclase (GGDEF)-like protein